MKKVLSLLLVAMLAVSLVACNSAEKPATADPVTEAVETADEATEAVTEEVAPTEETPAATETPAGELPEIDGFTKSDFAGQTIYQSADGLQAVTVLSVPTTPEQITSFESKDANFLSPEIKAQLAAMGSGDATGEFKDMAGKSVYVMNLEIPKNEAAGIPVDTSSTMCILPSGENINIIVGAVSGEGSVEKALETLVAAV